MKLGGLRYECFEESPNYQPGDEKFNKKILVKIKYKHVFCLFFSDYLRILLIGAFAANAVYGNYGLAAMCYVTSFALDEVDGNSARYLGQSKYCVENIFAL